jgi:hypothetical protein
MDAHAAFLRWKINANSLTNQANISFGLCIYLMIIHWRICKEVKIIWLTNNVCLKFHVGIYRILVMLFALIIVDLYTRVHWLCSFSQLLHLLLLVDNWETLLPAFACVEIEFEPFQCSLFGWRWAARLFTWNQRKGKATYLHGIRALTDSMN